MKIIRTFLIVFFVCLTTISSVKAAPAPPSPDAAMSTMADDPNLPPPPPPIDTPIDSNLAILLLGGLILGTTVVYNNKMKKASI